ncbi:NAD(P)-dependent dehydrogenase (short-subunit alcohol dehydrogenase family) [Kibdelosporangium banguiense]|uniref:NAD(P)-dependent dehydrogenase (Short-subunit alcohol dehydrogenase family) n=1 Tax=Kibdelosporangium banguiense TaxID=1365924 RepID=A0ABS4TUG3_9PSEU|nr:SDR family oxidoreductase [Kibdelosporangium banguiense]MBP2328050.1 NAD(P)-dependent dehydrogenase (short-subunit alcohol dehydrogenase family) [Kibdelosporangium banguiense]
MDLDGQVAIVTGAGRGLGRAHALQLAALGARVVVNDAGTATDGEGRDHSVAQQVVDEIIAAGGHAVASTDSVSDWDGAKCLVATAIDTFSQLDIVVNNAGILRDRMLVNMSEAEFDAVLDVHLKGTFCVSRHAANHWRERSKAGERVTAAIVNTGSGAGLFNNVGQANYAAAKAAIVAFSQVAAKELARYGVRVNTIAPMARTRLVQQTPGLGELTESIKDSGFDPWLPANISPLVAYLASPRSKFTGGIWHVFGCRVDLVGGYTFQHTVTSDEPWTLDALDEVLRPLDANGLLSEEMGLDEVVRMLTAKGNA